MNVLIEPTRLGRWLANLILFTPLGDSHWACGAHRWLARRFPRLLHRRVVADEGVEALSNEQVARLLASGRPPRKPR